MPFFNGQRGPNQGSQQSNDEFSQRRQAYNEQRVEEFKVHMKKNLRLFGLLFLLIAVLLSLNSFIYIVAEDEVATVRQFGRITKVIVDRSNTEAEVQNALDPKFSDIEIVKDKGLFFKVPFITSVEKDTSKLLTYMSNYAQINTLDKIKYQIAMYAQWEITHPGLFRSSLGTVTKANGYIDELAYAVVIENINSLNSTTFLTDKDELSAVLDVAMERLNERVASRGIILRDIDVYRTILPPSNLESTYNKMIAEREAIAQQIRSEGLELYQNTVSDTDRQVVTIKANAIEEAETIKGQADAEAIQIYAEGFNRDPEFYRFWRSLISYEKAIDEDTVLYMDSNNQYLDLFSGGE
jgi:membrane protease subunit HflC